MKNGRRMILIIITIILIAAAVVEAGILYGMVSKVIRGESPRQLRESGATDPAEPPAEEDSPPADVAEEPDVEEPTEPVGKRLEGAGDIGPYHIELGEAELTEDTEGAAAIVISYTWTNNSEATASAMVMLIERAYQGGEQLSSAQVSESPAYDPDTVSRSVPPGGSLTVQRAFQLSGKSENLIIEVSEFLSHTKDAVVKEYDITKK